MFPVPSVIPAAMGATLVDHRAAGSVCWPKGWRACPNLDIKSLNSFKHWKINAQENSKTIRKGKNKHKQFSPALLTSIFLLFLGVHGALLLGSREQRWSSIRPRWPWLIKFINVSCCSSEPSCWIRKADMDQTHHQGKRLVKYFMCQEHIGTSMELECCCWVGTCRWLAGTDRSLLFLSGVLSVTEMCGAEPWWLGIPGSWHTVAVQGRFHSLIHHNRWLVASWLPLPDSWT